MSALHFVAPEALWALLALPVIWWLLRVMPPRATSQVFPPIRILSQIKSTRETPNRTPWWLLLLRLCLAALLIFAVAHPFTRAGQMLAANNGPLLLVMDDGWAAAQDWQKRQEAALSLLNEARSRVVFFATTAEPQAPVAKSAADVAKALRALKPQALTTNRNALLPPLQKIEPKPSEAIWLTDNIDAASGQSFASGLQAVAQLQILDVPNHAAPLALGQPALTNGEIVVPILRGANAASTTTLQAIAGDGHVLGESKVDLGTAQQKEARLALPVELRNELQRLSLKDQHQAGAISLLDDAWRRKTVALISGDAEQTGQPLLAASHYLVSALAGEAEITTPKGADELRQTLDSGLSMLILTDVGQLNADQHDAIEKWLSKGGLLLRFAGPKLAAAADDLTPVQLRAGDRNLGAAMSWETPQEVRPFDDKGPFAGIAVDPTSRISRQLLAEPDTDLPVKTWASLADGTPLITSAKHGAGRIVLFHVTANADWSNLPLTGTFASILQRLIEMAPSAGNPAAQGKAAEAFGDFAPHLMLTGEGELVTPTKDVKPIAAKDIQSASATPQTPAGFYARGTETRAVNVHLKPEDLAPLPASLAVSPLKPQETQHYAPLLFTLATLLFLVDCLAALFINGGGVRRASAGAATLLFAVLTFHPTPSRAEDAAPQVPPAALQTRIAYVKTGHSDIDDESRQGLKSLGEWIMSRSSAVLGEPQGVDIESDELVFYPLLYWPVAEDAGVLGAKAQSRLSDYMKNGGTVFFDLRDASATPGGGPTGEALRRLLAPLDIPPLQTVPDGHALTKSFYLLKTFPGRYAGAPLWVEQQDDPQSAGFDNVSGVIIGSNDYAAAWATDDNGQPLYALETDSAGQHDMALRVGMNVVMYVLTGNYKTDQVHIPAILERLGEK